MTGPFRRPASLAHGGRRRAHRGPNEGGCCRGQQSPCEGEGATRVPGISLRRPSKPRAPRAASSGEPPRRAAAGRSGTQARAGLPGSWSAQDGPARAPQKPPGRRRGPDPPTPLDQARPPGRGRGATGWARAGGGRGGAGPAGRRQRRERYGARPEMGTSEQGAAEKGASPGHAAPPAHAPAGAVPAARPGSGGSLPLIGSHWGTCSSLSQSLRRWGCRRNWLRPGSRVPGGADNFPPHSHVGWGMGAKLAIGGGGPRETRVNRSRSGPLRLRRPADPPARPAPRSLQRSSGSPVPHCRPRAFPGAMGAAGGA